MTPTFVTRLTDALISLFDPIVSALESPAASGLLLADMGYKLPSPGAFLSDFEPLAHNLITIVSSADDALRGDSEPDYIALFTSLVDAGREVDQAIGSVGPKLQAALPAAFVSATNIIERFPRQLTDYLLIRMLDRNFPQLRASLALCGILVEQEVSETPTSFNVPYTERRIRWEQVGHYVDRAVPLIAEHYGWNTAAFDYDLVRSNLCRLATQFGAFATLDTPDPGRLAALHHGTDVVPDSDDQSLWTLKVPLLPEVDCPAGIEVYPILSAPGGPFAGLGLILVFDPANGLSFPISERLSLEIAYPETTRLAAGVIALPGQALEQVTIDPGATADSLAAFLPELRYADADEKILLFDTSFGAKLEMSSISVRGGLHPGFSGLYAEAVLKGCALTISSEHADGFLKAILPSDPLTLAFDLTAGFSTKNGLYFAGGAGLSVRIPTVASVGPVSLLATTIGLRSSDNKLALTLGADIRGELGPLTIVIQEVGAKFALALPQDGNAKPKLDDLSIRFKPPSGLAIVVDAGAIKGGGAIFYEPEEGMYGGAFELSFAAISLKAIVVLRTKVDGAPFALLAMVYARFPGGLELGLRFTLNAVGGMIGINHRFDYQALVEAVPSGALDDILFPENPVADSRRIIASLTAICPVEPKAYTLAIMAELGWGSDYICALRLGVVLPLNDMRHIYLIGQVRIQCFQDLPEAIRLQLICDALGDIGFDPFSVRIDGRLRDSRFGPIGIEGQIIFEVKTGPDPRFLIAAGGFHPNFKAIPPGIPANIDRLAVTYAVGAFKAWLKGYFALAAGTVQFGAEIGCRYKAGSISFQGDLGIDALIHLEPFTFEAEARFNVAVEYRSHELFGVHIKANFWGPDRWRVKGHGSFSILFWDVGIDFDESWGDDVASAAQPIILLEKARADLENDSYWMFETAAAGVAAGALQFAAQDNASPAVHPLATLAYKQRRFPFGMELDHIGSAPIEGARSVPVPSFTNDEDGSPIAGAPALDPFAIGEYVDLPDEERLTRPSFEPLPAGASAGIQGYRLPDGEVVEADVDYEQIFLPRKSKFNQGLGLEDLHSDLIRSLLGDEAAGRSRARVRNRMARPRPPVRSEPAKWTIADEETLEAAPIESKDWKDQSPTALEQDKTKRGRTLILESFELAA
jgi:hypothetical protein